MNTKDFIVNQSRQTQIVKDFGTMPPNTDYKKSLVLRKSETDHRKKKKKKT